MKLKLLGVANNAKTIKGDGSEYLTAIMYLAPADKVDGVNLCPMAVLAGCKAGCLDSAGRGAFNNVQAARIRKTIFWRDYRDLFLDQLRQDIKAFIKYCKKKDVQPCIRLNGTSDIRWENYIDMQGEFPEAIFYDYTKDANRLSRPLPNNYHLTLSYSEASDKYKSMILGAMGKHKHSNMAVVFRHKDTMPKTFKGFKVIDGDKDDLRFLDPKGVVVGLYAKGKAKQDASGFVIG